MALIEKKFGHPWFKCHLGKQDSPKICNIPPVPSLSEKVPDWTGWFTFLSAKEAQGRDLRECAATEEHDQDDAL